MRFFYFPFHLLKVNMINFFNKKQVIFWNSKEVHIKGKTTGIKEIQIQPEYCLVLVSPPIADISPIMHLDFTCSCTNEHEIRLWRFGVDLVKLWWLKVVNIKWTVISTSFKLYIHECDQIYFLENINQILTFSLLLFEPRFLIYHLRHGFLEMTSTTGVPNLVNSAP